MTDYSIDDVTERELSKYAYLTVKENLKGMELEMQANTKKHANIIGQPTLSQLLHTEY